MATKYKALGAYIFAGGFTRGVLDTKRFDVLEHLEEGSYGVPTARLNFPKLPIRVGFDSWDLSRYKPGSVDFIYGNPPCAAWSRLNGRKTVSEASWARDPRVSCTRAHFGLLETLKPRVWVWESVDMAFQAGQCFVSELGDRAWNLGYSVSHLRFDAQYVGGSHRRQRYFMVAHNVAIPWADLIKFVEPPTAGEVLSGAKALTLDDAVCAKIPKSLIPAWKATKPGKPVRATWDKLNPPEKHVIRTTSTGKQYIVDRPGFSKVKLNFNAVCPTVVGNNLLHQDEPRFLSMAEQKALCGYPPTWRTELEGSDSGSRLDIFTRAVMPPIGKWIAGIVANALDQGVKVSRRDRALLVVDARKPADGVVVSQHFPLPYFPTQQLAMDLDGG